MATKKGIIILVIIALVLAVTAITLRVTDSNEIPTTRDTSFDADTGAGEVGVIILPGEIEDKGAENPEAQA